ncbi:hypothetical protein [Cognatilysobacter lacus]|uniref:hypothetical protein n=1 Tax=Cognatilysobacter lacus TaxID=1643323 RepID=UPI001961CA8E|nr:hypothetical protein [Lysobacter lacus]
MFGVLFAINSSLHGYLIVAFAREDGVSLDVGFYLMANAMGRLLGTVVSGWIYQACGLSACLAWSGGSFYSRRRCRWHCRVTKGMYQRLRDGEGS